MNRVLAFLTMLCLSTGIFAQSIDPAQNPHNGVRLAETGRAIMFTGASLAMTGAAIFISGALTFKNDSETPTMPLFPVFAALYGVTGAAFTLVGLPFYVTGKSRMNGCGATFINFGEGARPGPAGIFNVGVGVPGIISVDAIPGYNFNGRFFLGGGIGYRAFFSPIEIDNYGLTYSIPIYAHARYTMGKGRTAPYAGLSLGYDAKQANLYTGLEFGVRIRSLKSMEKGSSWWISSYLDSGIMSLRVGKSF